MRRLVVALVAALMIVTLVGCGGGEEPAGEVTAQTQAPAAPAAALAAEEADMGDLTALEEQTYEPFPTDEEVVTEEILDRIDVGQPMIVYFYDGAQKTSDDQRAEIDAVLKDYRGLIELVAYDAGTYVVISDTGKVTVSPDLLEDDTANRVARLMSGDFLGVSFTPYLFFVDSDGYITYRYRGFVDRELVERQVLRATE